MSGWIGDLIGCVCDDLFEETKDIIPNPVISLAATIVTAVANGISLWGGWSVWDHFQKTGFSDNPLIPPSVPWMDGWLAFVIVHTIVALFELIVGVVAFCGEIYIYIAESDEDETMKKEGKVFRFQLRYVEEGLNAVGIFSSVLLIMLGFFYYVVQSDCLDLNHIDEVIIGTAVISSNIVWKIVKFVLEMLIHLGAFSCCCKGNWRDLRPKIVMNTICCRMFLAPVLAIAGFVLLGLLVNLTAKTNSFERSSIQVMRSEPYMVYFSITDFPANDTENITFTEALPLEMPGVDANLNYCLATFRYDSDSYEFVFNVALIDLNATIENNTCVCVPNHDLCEPFYDNLYYGHSSDGDPYKCFVRASKLVGVDKENSPTRDRESEVHCTCEALPLMLGSGSGSGSSGTLMLAIGSGSGSNGTAMLAIGSGSGSNGTAMLAIGSGSGSNGTA